MSNNLGKEKVESFRNLELGWFYGSGIKPTDATIRNSLILLEEIINSGFEKTDAFPGENGEIQVTGYLRDEYIEIIVDSDNINLISFEVNDEEVYYKEDISISNTLQLINHRRGIAWLLSGLSTGVSLIQQRDDLQVFASSPPLMVQEYQFSTEPALSNPANRYAATSSGFTVNPTTKTLPVSGLFQSIKSSPNIPLNQYPARQVTNVI